MSRAASRIFGYELLNARTARDVQCWEMPPLGPFLAKFLSTTISPRVVTSEALAPFAVPARARGEGQPAPLAHLDSSANRDGAACSSRWRSTC